MDLDDEGNPFFIFRQWLYTTFLIIENSQLSMEITRREK